MLNFILKTTGLKKDTAPTQEEAPKQQLRRSSRRKSSLVSLTETEPEETEPQVAGKVDSNFGTISTDEKKDLGVRKSGRVWKAQKTPLRIRAVGVSKRDTEWDRKRRERLALRAFKEKARELKEEKEAERKVRYFNQVVFYFYFLLFIESLTIVFFCSVLLRLEKPTSWQRKKRSDTSYSQRKCTQR